MEEMKKTDKGDCLQKLGMREHGKEIKRVGFVSYVPLGAASFHRRKVITSSTNQIK